MNIDDKVVSYVADLANLELTAEERARLVTDLNSIIGYIDQLKELDTANVEPMAQVSERFGAAGLSGSERFAYTQRADVIGPSLPHHEALANAPGADEDFFIVPKVIEK
jgi:aspartyl-tRNA(Asn)/glutamyl-tRNA(Gln) amidotransferase subunit C